MHVKPPEHANDAAKTKNLIACPDCDLLQHEVEVARHSDAHCVRCGALLYRGTRARLDWMLALMLGSAALLIVSNVFPIAAFEVQGSANATTLMGTVWALIEQGRPLVALLVLATAIVIPAIELSVMLYMLIPLRFGHVPHGVPFLFRCVIALHPWSMMEVFMLGVLVTLVKLADLATVVPGIALWAFIGLIVLFSAAAASFSARDFWGWVEARKAAVSS